MRSPGCAASWSQACGGRRAVVWVAGEPGIGKTTLIEHFVAGLGDVAVARGQCVEHYGTGEPYLPVLEALAELCRKDADLPALLRTVAPTWLLQLPWLGSFGGTRRTCGENWPAWALSACCGRWASCWTATPSSARCCW